MEIQPHFKPQIQGLPFIPFRYLKIRSQKLTTIVGVQGRDGIVLCADVQETVQGTREIVTKLDELGNDCLFGGACNDVTFLLNFEEMCLRPVCLRNDSPQSFKARLDQALIDYETGFDHRYNSLSDRAYRQKQDQALVQGVIARRYVNERNETEYELYEFDNFSLSKRVTNARAVAGSGGIYARLLFQGGERIMRSFQFEWKRFSVRFLEQFCSLMIGTVVEYDSNSSGFQIYELTADSRKPLNLTDVFPNQRPDQFRFSMLIEQAMNELGPDALVNLINNYEMLDILKRKLQQNPRLKQMILDTISFLSEKQESLNQVQ